MFIHVYLFIYTLFQVTKDLTNEFALCTFSEPIKRHIYFHTSKIKERFYFCKTKDNFVRKSKFRHKVRKSKFRQ
jgi:hypothetical protein